MPMKSLPMNRLIPLLVAALALACGLIVLNAGALDAAGGRVLALDDVYIHLQYGWQAAQGHFLQYNAGDPPSTGATSLLYMLLLAAGFALGITRAAMPGVMVGLGLILFPLSAALLADTARRALDAVHARRGPLDSTPPPAFPTWSAGLIAGGLFAASGWMAWAFLSGMETGLLIALVAATLWAFVQGRVRLTALFAALAILTRPEAVILAGMLVIAQALLDPAETNDRLRRLLWGLAPLGALLVSPLIALTLTGSPSASGLLAKSWFTIQPFYLDSTLLEIAAIKLELLVRLFGGMASDGLWHVFPLTQVFGLVGALVLWSRGRVRERRLALVCAGWVVLGIGATATLQTATWHHYRYQMPLYPALVMLMGVGLAALLSEMAARLREQRIPRGVVAGGALILLAVWSAASVRAFRAEYATDTRTVLEQQIPLADWLRANTPEDALVAVHDVGVMRYLGERATYDVVGLTTTGMAAVNRHGPGAIYERLEQVQPDYYAVYPDVAPPYYGVEAAPALFGEELHRVALEGWWSRYTSAGPAQVITRPDWSGAALAEAAQQPHLLDRLAGWTLTDALDVADIDSEAAHGYAWWHAARPEGFLTLPLVMAYHDAPAITVTDAVRQLTGGESFTLETPQIGQALLIAGRFHVTADTTVRVHVGAYDAGLWKLPALPGEWLESAFTIPPGVVQAAQTPIRLTLEGAPAGVFLSAGHYWAYQGQPEALPPAPGAISGAAFAEVVRLRGFDLPGRSFAAGDVLPLTLHWQAIAPPRADHRVFIHLMDPANDSAEGIVAQVDGQPGGGTYPFWVWAAGESYSETLLLSIPADTAPGRYQLLLGIYDGVSGERLPIVGGEDYGASRLILAPIAIR